MKKTIKKLTALGVSAIIAASTCTFVTASADSPAPHDGDLNNDGSVTMLDMTILNKYLSGRCSLNDLEAADVDCDLAIGKADQQILLLYLVGSITTWPYCDSSMYSDLTAPWMATYTGFTVYNCAENSTDGYYLTANVDIYSLEDELMTADSYVDDRTEATDISVVQVGSGSGFIIDDHVIATAAHCVYNKASSSFNDPLTIKVKNADCTTTLLTTTAKEIHVPNDYITETDIGERYKYDYALVYVGDDVDLSQYGAYSLGVLSDEFIAKEEESPDIYVCGFPGGYGGVRYVASGDIRDINDYEDNVYEETGVRYALDQHQIMYSTYTTSGQSGGPVYIENTIGGTVYRTAIGIHTSGASTVNDVLCRFGTRMTPTLLHFFSNNDYIGSTLS